jgi:hypothetical protein
MEDVGIFKAILSVLWPFGTFYGHLDFFNVLVPMLYREKYGNPEPNHLNKNIFWWWWWWGSTFSESTAS